MPLLEDLLGPDRAVRLGGLCAQQTGMHCADLLGSAFDMNNPAQPDPSDIARLLSGILAADGSISSTAGSQVSLSAWRLFDTTTISEAVLGQFTGCLRGIVATHNRFFSLGCRSTDQEIVWTVNHH